MKRIQTVGDSHAVFAWDKILVPGWTVERLHLGSRLMHTFAAKGEEFVNFEDLGLRPGDALVLSFGEIDCRVHAHQYGIEGLADQYMAKVASMTKHLAPGPRALMGVVPPEREPAPICAGSAEERLGYAHSLNRDLAYLAPLAGWRFLNVYRAYAGPDGFFDPTLLGHRGHIGDPGPLEDMVRRWLGTGA